MKRIVIVGGGISGLAAAWSAWEATGSGSVEVLLVEADAEVGGKTRSMVDGDWLFEAGPTGYLDNEPILDTLVERAGLEKLPAQEAAAHRFLVRGGKLREVQANPLRFAASGILSPLGLLRILREPWIARRDDPTEESIWDFAERRLGSEAAARLVAPMVLGVFAGDAKKLSLGAAFPRMAELEAKYSSLFRAMRQLARDKELRGGPAGPAGVLTSFADGLQALPRKLAERAPFSVRTGARVSELAVVNESVPWRLRVEGDREAIVADAVILAGEVWSTAALLEGVEPRIAAELSAIPAPGLSVVGLGFGPKERARTPVGFGALIPREEGLRILGVLWDTHLFPGRGPRGGILMRAMIGGATNPELAMLEEDELVAIARADLKCLLGVDSEPWMIAVARWPRAIPQYEVGHLARMERVARSLARLRQRAPGLRLAGNFQRGVAFGKAALQGWEAGQAAGVALRPGARVGAS